MFPNEEAEEGGVWHLVSVGLSDDCRVDAVVVVSLCWFYHSSSSLVLISWTPLSFKLLLSSCSFLYCSWFPVLFPFPYMIQ